MIRLRQPLSPKLTHRARALRRDSTSPERLLWRALRSRQLAGLKFRRQFVIHPYVVEVYCPEANLVVEVDGESHVGQSRRDAARTAFLEAKGVRVLRVTNDEVLHHLDAVLTAIARAAGVKES